MAYSYMAQFRVGATRWRNQLSTNRCGLGSAAAPSWRPSMQHYVGLDVSLKQTAVCLVDQPVRSHAKGWVASEPKAIANFIAANAPQAIPHRLREWRDVDLAG